MKTVLNIQSHEQVALLMTWILSERGFQVVDAREATLMQAEDGIPHVIIINSDMKLPEKRACVAALRLIAPQAGIVDLSHDVEAGDYDSGADQYLSKPFLGDDLIARVIAACA